MSRILVSSLKACAGLAVLALFVPASGCGPGEANVTGKITYKGAPVPNGSVTFHGENDWAQSAWIDPNGNYTITGAPVGPVKVTVVSSQPRNAPAMGGPKSVANHPGDKGAKAAPAAGVALPEKYKDPDQSGLTYTLANGEQSIDIPLE
jgi:hypothetical protein